MKIRVKEYNAQDKQGTSDDSENFRPLLMKDIVQDLEYYVINEGDAFTYVKFKVDHTPFKCKNSTNRYMRYFKTKIKLNFIFVKK